MLGVVVLLRLVVIPGLVITEVGGARSAIVLGTPGPLALAVVFVIVVVGS
jgi:hypothetical protein